MADRIKKGVGSAIVDHLKSNTTDNRVPVYAKDGNGGGVIEAGAEAPEGYSLEKPNTIDQSNATYGIDPAVDNIIASQYLDPKDKLKETYVDKIGMETGTYADIQNIDNKILDTYKILGMPDNDIFSRRDLSPEEKVAMSRERRDIAVKRNGHLRKLRQYRMQEIQDLAEFEAEKERQKQNTLKEAMSYQKQLLEERRFGLEERKFGLTLGKAEADVELKAEAHNLAVDKFKFEKNEKYFAGITNRALLDTPDGTILKTRLPSVTNPNGGKECGEYVNDVMGGSIGKFGDTFESKLGVANEQYGGIGAAAVWNPGNNEFGHVGVIIGDQGDNWIIKSSNLRNDGTISTDVIPKSHISGYKNVSKVSKDTVEDVNFDTVESFNKSIITHKTKKISNDVAQNLVIKDMGNNQLGTKTLKEMLSYGSVSQELLDDYTNITYGMQAYSSASDEQIVSALKDVDWENLSKEEKEDELLQLAIVGKLKDGDDELFEGGWFDIDEDGYEVIVEHFDDVHKTIKEINERAENLRNKYNIK